MCTKCGNIGHYRRQCTVDPKHYAWEHNTRDKRNSMDQDTQDNSNNQSVASIEYEFDQLFPNRWAA